MSMRHLESTVSDLLLVTGGYIGKSDIEERGLHVNRIHIPSLSVCSDITAFGKVIQLHTKEH